MPEKRPFGVTMLLWMVLCLSAWGTLRLLAAMRWWDVLYEFEARLSPLYLAITGAGWALVGAALLWNAWSRKAWTYWAIPFAISLWVAVYWIERLFFQSPRANLSFALTVSMLLLALTAIITLNKRTRRYFSQKRGI